MRSKFAFALFCSFGLAACDSSTASESSTPEDVSADSQSGGTEADTGTEPAGDVFGPGAGEDVSASDGDVTAVGDTIAEDVADTSEPAHECPVAGQRPSALSEHAAVYDQTNQRLIIMGGNPEFPVECQGKNSFTAEAWAYDLRCKAWTPLAAGPSARGRAGVALDTDAHAMYVWGGRFREKGVSGLTAYTMLTDLWRLDLSTDTWTEVAAKGTIPPGRHSSTMAYDSKRHRLLLFGGSTSSSGASFTPQATTHAFDIETSTWEKLPTQSDPPKRLYAAGTVDLSRDLLIVMQGGDEQAFTGPFLGDVWGLDLTTNLWGKLASAGINAPDNRIWSAIAYLPATAQILMFGGHDDGSLGNRNDVWTFDPGDQSWLAQQQNDTFNKPSNGFCDFPADFAKVKVGTPERRGAHAMVYAPDRNSILVHAGKTDCGLIDDLWELTLDDWKWNNLEPASIGEACTRYSDNCKSLCY